MEEFQALVMDGIGVALNLPDLFCQSMCSPCCDVLSTSSSRVEGLVPPAAGLTASCQSLTIRPLLNCLS